MSEQICVHVNGQYIGSIKVGFTRFPTLFGNVFLFTYVLYENNVRNY